MAAALLLVGGLLALAQITPFLSDAGDDAEFLILAKALVMGQGYVWANDWDASPHTKYPPGYPLLLASLVRLTRTAESLPDTVVPAKILSTLLFVGLLALLYVFARRRYPAPLPLLGVALVAVNPYVLEYAAEVLSEIPYAVVSMAALVWFDRLGSHKQPRGHALSVVVSSLLLAAAYYTRAVGISLVGAAVAAAVVQLWRARGWRGPARTLLLSALLAAALIAVWEIRNIVLLRESVYAGQLVQRDPSGQEGGTVAAAELPQRALRNAATYLSRPVSGPLGPALVMVSIALVSLAGLGLGRQVRRSGWRVAELYVLIYAGVLLFWNWTGGRFLVPLVPLLSLYVLLGLQAVGSAVAGSQVGGTREYQIGVWNFFRDLGTASGLLRRAGGERRDRHQAGPSPPDSGPGAQITWPMAAAVGMILAVSLGLDVRSIASQRQAVAAARGNIDAYYGALGRPDWAHYLATARWLRDKTPTTGTVLARKHFLLHVYSDRAVAKYRYETSEEELDYVLRQPPPVYVVEDGFVFMRGDFGPLPAALQTRGVRLAPVFETEEPRVRIWQLAAP